MLCSRNGDIQSPFSAVAIQGSEVHRNTTRFVGAVADRKEYHVPFVSLYVLKIFYKYRLTMNRWIVAEMDFNVRQLATFLVQQVFDKSLLPLVECNDTK